MSQSGTPWRLWQMCDALLCLTNSLGFGPTSMATLE